MYKKILWVLPLLGIGLAGLAVLYLRPTTQEPLVTSFAECAALYPVLESYPRQCNTPSRQHFVEEITTPIEVPVVFDLSPLRIEAPVPESVLKSPTVVRGLAPGFWFFEASFPISLVDEQGGVIGTGIATAKSDWMTTELVPFETTIVHSAKPQSARGFLVFKKDNPSGLPEHDAEVRMPIIFSLP